MNSETIADRLQRKELQNIGIQQEIYFQNLSKFHQWYSLGNKNMKMLIDKPQYFSIHFL